MRWSVAMEPVTAMGTSAELSWLRTEKPRSRRVIGASGPSSVEAVAAGAGTARVRVVDREALLLDGVDEVDHGTLQVRGAEPVNPERQAVELAEQVTIAGLVVEVQAVLQARATAGLDLDAQVHVVP